MIERTMYRPRDLIVFFNICIDQALDRPEITAQMILHAEGDYSNKRLRSLYDEWYVEFPELETCIGILKGLPPRFTLDAIDDVKVLELCWKLATDDGSVRGRITDWAGDTFNDKMTPSEFRARLAGVFYRAGLVGLRTESSTATSWSFRHALSIPVAAIKQESVVHICPTFYRALAINPSSGGA